MSSLTLDVLSDGVLFEPGCLSKTVRSGPACRSEASEQARPEARMLSGLAWVSCLILFDLAEVSGLRLSAKDQPELGNLT